MGATSVPYPVLGKEDAGHVLERLQAEGWSPLPTLDTAEAASGILGQRPEEFLRALRKLRARTASGLEPDQLLPVIAATLQSIGHLCDDGSQVYGNHISRIAVMRPSWCRLRSATSMGFSSP